MKKYTDKADQIANEFLDSEGLDLCAALIDNDQEALAALRKKLIDACNEEMEESCSSQF